MEVKQARKKPAAAKAAPSPEAPRAERESSVEDIYERIYVAILEHRLQPGTKLGEERMADIFGVSRARIR
jgi:DNA-binding GntR family transcriptional regulator